MTNRSYRRGYQAELRAKRILERLGYTVIRAAGSHGLFDVCGFRRDGVVLVQVKRGVGRLSLAERGELRAACRNLPPNARVEYWRFLPRKKPLVEIL